MDPLVDQDILRRTSVIVVGAGLAGLAAAWELERHGAQVTVIEARSRIGGRVFTVREGFESAQHAEAGGDLIDEGQEEILRLVRTLGLETTPILSGGFGFVLETSEGPGMLPRGHTWRLLSERMAPYVRDYRLAEQRWDGAVATAFSRISLAQWLDASGAGAKLRSILRGLRGFFLADPEYLSLLAVVDELAGDMPGQSRMYRMLGGNDRLPTALAASLRAPVRLQTVLLAVSQQSKTVHVTLRHADGGESALAADYVVLALPATTLKKVAFRPSLPEDQWQAIATLKYGRATKTLVQFDRRFWQRDGCPRAYGTDRAVGAVWDANEEQRGAEGILTLLAGGSASDDTRAALREGGIDRLVSALAWLGADGAIVRAAHHIVWEDDPWAGGGYAYFDPGYDPGLRLRLAVPHGRVVFAGEHTSLRWQGYMNGAVESGLRAATEVRVMVAGQPR